MPASHEPTSKTRQAQLAAHPRFLLDNTDPTFSCKTPEPFTWGRSAVLKALAAAASFAWQSNTTSVPLYPQTQALCCILAPGSEVSFR